MRVENPYPISTSKEYREIDQSEVLLWIPTKLKRSHLEATAELHQRTMGTLQPLKLQKSKMAAWRHM
jgi:hypothetical protein